MGYFFYTTKSSFFAKYVGYKYFKHNWHYRGQRGILITGNP